MSANYLEKRCAVYWLLMRRCKQPIKTAPSILTFECSLFRLHSRLVQLPWRPFLPPPQHDVFLRNVIRNPTPARSRVLCREGPNDSLVQITWTRWCLNNHIPAALKISSALNQRQRLRGFGPASLICRGEKLWPPL